MPVLLIAKLGGSWTLPVKVSLGGHGALHHAPFDFVAKTPARASEHAPNLAVFPLLIPRGKRIENAAENRDFPAIGGG
jgi:hypothetical protein